MKEVGGSSAKMIYYDHQVEMQLNILSHCQPGGVFEFGVFQGQSLRLFKYADPNRKIVGFDSFKGLPETWRKGFEQGCFATVEKINIPNVEIVEGYFEDTVAKYFKDYKHPIGLFHIDCDLYSSSKTVLDGIAHLLKPGVVVLFDDYRNYVGYEKHEYRAWNETLEQYNIKAEEIAYSGHQQSAWRIL
tara:strand:+ start:718 stop:1281 length:564 start_codon:yes stop_codon:yes gene_type:complete